MFPALGFETQPPYIPNDTLIPTFDDVPDGPDPTLPGSPYTTADLSFFDANNMHMDFFINTNNWCGPIVGNPAVDDAQCYASLIDILKLHNPANHTIHHVHMGSDLPPDTTMMPPTPQSCDGASSGITCDAEMQGVESVIGTMSNGGRPHLTRFRAPFGEPFQTSGVGLADVQAVVAKYAVHVGWAMDCQDSNGQTYTGQQIADNVLALVGAGPGQGSWGVLLMHGTYAWTKDALPILFGANGALTKRGFKLATVEDAICWKFGKHSWEIVQQTSGQTRGQN